MRYRELLYEWRFTANQFVLATSPLRLTTIFFFNWTLAVSPYVTSSLTRGWVCRLQLLLGLASVVILRSEYRGTHDHILLSQIRNSPEFEGQVIVFISPRNRVAQLHPQALGSIFVASYDSLSYGGNIWPLLHTGYTLQVTVKVILRPTVSRPVCLGTKHPFGAYDQIFITCVIVTVLFFWGALSDERSGLSFVCAAGPCQRSLSLVQVPWNLRPYFTVSDLRLPFSSPPTTRRITVEVFDPASTRVHITDWTIHTYIE
jgi:hypothetical protein